MGKRLHGLALIAGIAFTLGALVASCASVYTVSDPLTGETAYAVRGITFNNLEGCGFILAGGDSYTLQGLTYTGGTVNYTVAYQGECHETTMRWFIDGELYDADGGIGDFNSLGAGVMTTRRQFTMDAASSGALMLATTARAELCGCAGDVSISDLANIQSLASDDPGAHESSSGESDDSEGGATGMW